MIGLVVITFRRNYAGLWCRKHANLRLIAASLISACFGWLGIPFGFIYTPPALYNLARGGIHLDEQNSKMLLQVAADKAKHGDQAGWKRCMEESLKFQASSSARRELSQKFLSIPVAVPPGFWNRLGRGLGVLLVTLGLGALVGFSSFLLGNLIGLMTKGGSNIFVVIFSWASHFACLSGRHPIIADARILLYPPAGEKTPRCCFVFFAGCSVDGLQHRP